jgi:hypothetical protein
MKDPPLKHFFGHTPIVMNSHPRDQTPDQPEKNYETPPSASTGPTLYTVVGRTCKWFPAEAADFDTILAEIASSLNGTIVANKSRD